MSVLPNFAKIADQMRRTSAQWYNAEVEIVDPNTADLEWDVVTNTYSNNPETILWHGSARVQPIRRPLASDMTVAQSSRREIRIQIPYCDGMPDFTPGMRVRVTQSDVDKALKNFTYVIRSAINSSYGWNRTIECDIDLDGVNNG